MLGPQRIIQTNPALPYAHPIKRTIPLQPMPIDVNWYDTWPIIRSILLGSAMLLSSAAIIGLDIANLAIEGRKNKLVKAFGFGTGKVGAGLWCGSLAFIAGIFIIATIFPNNKRIAAKFALRAVLLAFVFAVILVAFTGNHIQINKFYYPWDLDEKQRKLTIAILSLGAFNMVLCILFFIMYIVVSFSPYTHRPAIY